MSRKKIRKITPIGEFLKKLMIDNDETQTDLANKLGVTRNAIPQVLYDYRPMPSKWYYKIHELYSLNDEQREELDELMFTQNNRVKIDLTMFNDYARKSILTYAYGFYKMQNVGDK